MPNYGADKAWLKLCSEAEPSQVLAVPHKLFVMLRVKILIPKRI